MESQASEPHAPILAAFSPWSAVRDPVEFGLAASRLTGAPLVVVTVRRGGPVVGALGGDISDSPDEARTLEHLQLDLKRRGRRDVAVRVVGARTTAAGLESAVKELQPRLTIFGSSERGKVGSVLLGSTAERILHMRACPVAVVPTGYSRGESGVQRIGAAFGPSAEGTEALREAAKLARARDVRLLAIVVTDAERGEAEARVREALGELAGGIDLEVDVRTGDTADALLAAAEDVDLLVMGSRARGSRSAALLGSVSRKVSENAPCPVIVLPSGATELGEVPVADAAGGGDAATQTP